ncbi:MAG: hypothetical protein ABIQ74_04820 [Chitinophagales bacterium]
MYRILLYIVTPFLLASCNFFNTLDEKKEDPVARVYDKYLYESELGGVGSGAVRPEDSLQAMRNYIDSWVRHNLMLRYAQDNLPEEEQRLNDRLRDYKESLLIYQYENNLVSQKFDTLVSRFEMENYYNDHKDIFSLESGIAKVNYIMLRMGSNMDLDSVKHWICNSSDFNKPKLEGFCRRYAIKYSLNDNWYNKEELTALLPVRQFNLDNAQFNRSYIEVADSGYGYLIKFGDYRIKGNDAPIDFVKQDIANMIINQRKIAFVAGLRRNVYEDALKNGDFEIYENASNKQHSKPNINIP